MLRCNKKIIVYGKEMHEEKKINNFNGLSNFYVNDLLSGTILQIRDCIYAGRHVCTKKFISIINFIANSNIKQRLGSSQLVVLP
jgi:hypothetical protein